MGKKVHVKNNKSCEGFKILKFIILKLFLEYDQKMSSQKVFYRSHSLKYCVIKTMYVWHDNYLY
jgi:hypothetical protein